MKSRQEQRTAAVLPVRIMGRDREGKPQIVIAHTVDVSLHGAHVAGMSSDFPVGQFLFVQRRGVKCQFQVRWCTLQADHLWSAGLRCLEPEKNIWDLTFGPAVADSPTAIPFFRKQQPEPARPVRPEASKESERRKHLRIPCDTGVELLSNDRSIRTWARCTDLSNSGCYIQTRSPSVTGTRLVVQFSDIPTRPSSIAEVRTSDPGLGMGLLFREMRPEDRQVVSSYITGLVSTGAHPSKNFEDDGLKEKVAKALEVCRCIQLRLANPVSDAAAASRDGESEHMLTPELYEALVIAVAVIAPALKAAATSGKYPDVSREVVEVAIESVYRLEQVLTGWQQQRLPRVSTTVTPPALASTSEEYSHEEHDRITPLPLQ